MSRHPPLGALGLAFLFAVVLPFSSWGAEKPKIAVLPLTAGPGVDPKVASLITESLVSETNNRLGIRVVSTQEIQATLGFERQRQLLGCNEESSCLAEIGGALGVDKIVIGTLGRLGGSLIFNLQLVNMHTSMAEKRFSKRIKGTSEEGFLDAVGEAVDALFPPESAGTPPPAPTGSREKPKPPPTTRPAPPPPPQQVASREPPSDAASSQAVTTTAPEVSEGGRFGVALRGQLSPSLQVGGPLEPGYALSLWVGFRPLPALSLNAGLMTSGTSTGGLIRIAWIPWNAEGAIHPVLAVEGMALIFHQSQPLPTVGVSLNPGVEFLPLPWLTLGVEVPLTFLAVTPDQKPAPFWIFGAVTAGVRF